MHEIRATIPQECVAEAVLDSIHSNIVPSPSDFELQHGSVERGANPRF